MRIHHLNCGTLCVLGERLVTGSGSPLARTPIICHCLLIEAESGLILVDTGIGLGDIARPGRMGRPFTTTMKPRFDPLETAARQVEALGFRRDDVRDIVVTHLDLDHAGGLGDFPAARVHVGDVEHGAAMRRASLNERGRYVTAQWAHAPRWETHAPGGDRWMGFESAQTLAGDGGPEVLLIPLFGHTRGHCGVAVQTGDGWLLHAGDAYFYRGETDPVRPTSTPGLSLFQRLLAVDDRARRANQLRLRELRRDHGGEVRIFCAHDPVELESFQRA